MSDDGDPGGANGLTVGGRYRLLERIGSGGAGTVWRAHDLLAEREVAVKQPWPPGDPQDETHRRTAHRLFHEARAAARVDHPSAVTIHDVVVEGAEAEGGPPWIVMELVPGESLHAVLGRGALDPAETARIGLAVLGALRAAHAVGIVHRDLKPANVLLGADGRVVVTDFGTAHPRGEESPAVTGESVAALEFLAPEHLSGRGAGPASDLWSLGALLYAAVEGTSPFRRTSPRDTSAAILAAAPPEPKRSGLLGPLLVRLLTRDPERRPGAAEVAEELAAVAGLPASEPEPEPRASAPEPTAPAPTVAPTDAPTRTPLHRRPLPLTVLTLLLAGGAWLGTSFLGEPDSGAAPQASVWVTHPEPAMAAVLTLPTRYRESARRGGGGAQPRLVVYSAGSVDVRLTQWDRAPAAPMDRAAQAGTGWSGQDADARTRATRTTFQGYEAALADTTYRAAESPTRVLELFVRTDDSRMYELRVDMPQGTAAERRGAAVFEEARDRLEIGNG
ncbi:hypothetical protein JCM4814A_21890 [Streptomyces phaeofaciens JCM 4814]|uniref:non-specific serine/threonine protein kinase n=1 Tax=Streptomyces phaeofaciens TaxID=68254 RepID=A0A918H513_9ACTN|nr:serine/threonine-protein kinase [Streptomyces phaeofaciens]GGT33845.1 hypothetical protein GCM10010226_07240 [Streptomyces phaeofaciens]